VIVRFVLLLPVCVLAACGYGGSDNSPQAQCERQARDDPALEDVYHQPWVDTYKVKFIINQALVKCLRQKGLAPLGGVEPVQVQK